MRRTADVIRKVELEEKINEIRARLDASLERKATLSPRRANYVSDLGHPCLRYLVYARLKWEERRRPPIEAMYRMEDGKAYELQFLRTLNEAGISLELEQQAYFWEEFLISGRIDGMLQVGGQTYPVEIKTVSEHIYHDINTQEDMRDGGWNERYLAQIMMYLLLASKECGILVLKAFGKKPKMIPIFLDYDFCESLLKKAQQINSYVEKKEYPERHIWSGCFKCDFVHLCTPETLKTIEPATDELVQKVKRWAELKPQAKEFEKLDQEIKEIAKDKNIVAENFQIQTTTYYTTVYEIPEEIKKRYAQKVERKKVAIKIIE